jgi:hypothetical protein
LEFDEDARALDRFGVELEAALVRTRKEGQIAKPKAVPRSPAWS